MSEWKKSMLVAVIFLACFYLPVENAGFNNALFEGMALTRWYAREHVLLCLAPAFFIAGAISVFVSQGSIMRYFGPKANKFLAYGVASVSGTILAVCSCTVLPLFAGIYKRGAGLGPATAFLYSGPAINVLAIILTARILGLELGAARAAGAVFFSVVIGLLMQIIFRKEERAARVPQGFVMSEAEEVRPLWQNLIYFFSMVAILVFANWGKPISGDAGVWGLVYASRWWITGFFGVVLAFALTSWFGKEELKEWAGASWTFALQILPLLLGGVFLSGFLLGRVGHEGIIPSQYVSAFVGGNSLFANFFASIVGVFMYFATLTEVPIVQGLIGSGMGKGPALALLLAGPALSLPSMFVIRSVLGTRKTLVYVGLVIAMSTVTGMIYGMIAI